MMLVLIRVCHLKFINPSIVVNTPNQIPDQARPSRAIQESRDPAHVLRRETGVAVAERSIRGRKSGR